MPRLALDLNKDEDRRQVEGVWRYAMGFVPGEPNQGLTAEIEGSPARLADYDDSSWEIRENVRAGLSSGFSFVWFRMTVTLPETIEGQPITGSTVIFETTVDDYGEVWVDGEIDIVNGGVAGWNRAQRVTITTNATPGAKHVIAVLAANGPLAKPMGGVWLRYAYLAFESRG
jgi:hypothetical protein